MKMLKKRLTALVLTLAMVLALAPVMTPSAGATEVISPLDPRYDNYYYDHYSDLWEFAADWGGSTYDEVIEWFEYRHAAGLDPTNFEPNIFHKLFAGIMAILATESAVFFGAVPLELKAIRTEYLPEMADIAWGFIQRASTDSLAMMLQHDVANATITSTTAEEARTKNTVYSACGSLFWDEACQYPVEHLNSPYITVSGKEGYELSGVSGLTITCTLPDGFVFHDFDGSLCQKVQRNFQGGGSSDQEHWGSSGQSTWVELPNIYPVYVGNAAPDTYCCMEVEISGQYKVYDYTLYGQPRSEYWQTVEGCKQTIPFCYIADAWNTVDVSIGGIGETSIAWKNEDAYRDNNNYNGDAARLSAVLSALSGDQDATMSTLAKLGFQDFRAVENGSSGVGAIIGTKALTDTAYTIAVMTGNAEQTEWLDTLDVGGAGNSWADYYAYDIWRAAFLLDTSVSSQVSSSRSTGTSGITGHYKDAYLLCTGFGKAGAVAEEVANLASLKTYKQGDHVVAYTFGAPHYRRQAHPNYIGHPYVYNLVYAQDPICAAPSGQYYSSLGETYYVLNSGINPVKDKGDGTWTDNCGVTYKTVSWVGDYTDQGGNTAQNISQCATVNELIAAALHAWDPYNSNGNEANPNTVVYLAQVEAVLQQYGATLRDVSPQAHSMAVYWQLLDGAWHPSSTNAAWFHQHFVDLYKAFFAPRPDDTKKPGEEPTQPDEPTDPDTPAPSGSTGEDGGNGGGSYAEFHTFEGDCSVLVNNSEGRPVAMIASVPGQSPVGISVNRSVTVISAGDQKLALITEPEKFTIQVLSVDENTASTFSHTVYQAGSINDTITVLEQGSVTVPGDKIITLPAAVEANITGAATESTYARSEMQPDIGAAQVSPTTPKLYSGNPVEPAKPAAKKTANPTNDKLSVNGNQTEQATIYKIGGSNYFKLRDVAALLSGTSAQFNVGYDDASKTVILTTGQGYKAKKSDLKGAAKAAKQTQAGRDTILIDGVEKELKAYKIGGSNYFKLRDLGKALGFTVDYKNGVAIITTK